MDFYLQDSRTYTGNDLMFWKQGGKGYTSDLRLAQVYSRGSAQRQHDIRQTDIPWPVEYIQARARPVVDHQDLNIAEAMRNDTTGIRLTLDSAQEKLEQRYKCAGCGVFMSAAGRYCGPCAKCGTDNRP